MTEEAAARHRRPLNKTRGGRGILKSNPKYSATPNPNAHTSTHHAAAAAAVVSDRLGGDGGVVDLNSPAVELLDGSYGQGAAAAEEQAMGAATAAMSNNKPLVRDVVERDPRKVSGVVRGRPISASAGTSSSSSSDIEGYSPVTGAGTASTSIGVVTPVTSNDIIGNIPPPTEQDKPEAGPIASFSSKATTHPPSSERTGKPKSGGATVVRSISELVAMAQGTSDEAADGVDVAELRRMQEAGDEVAVETEMSFACMTEDEYKETVQLAERLELLGDKGGTKTNASSKSRDGAGYHDRDVKETDATDDAGEGEEEGVTDVDFEESCVLNCGGDEPSMEEVFFGKQNVFGEDTDDDDDSENVERNEEYEGDRVSGEGDGDGFMNFFGVDDDDSVGEAEPAPKPFIQLWNAMSSWITPETAQILQEWDKEVVSGDAVASAPSSVLRQPYDTSDIGASRCGGLMSMVKMNLPRALEELGFDRSDNHVRRLAEARLANFVRTFNYSDPMVKFDSTLWKALTVVLVGICFPSSLLYPDVVGESSENDDDVTEISTPATIQQLGISGDEYRYLTKSALKSLSVGGA